MRKKIYRLSEGQVDREKAALTITPETIDVTVRENVAYEGSFTVSSDNNVPLRGVVYSSQPYVVCQTPAFEGEEVVIRYKFIHDGFRESDEIKGAFTLICDGQTKMVPYSFRISAAEISSSMGPIRDKGSWPVRSTVCSRFIAVTEMPCPIPRTWRAFWSP